MSLHAVDGDRSPDTAAELPERYRLDLIEPSDEFDLRHGGFSTHALQTKYRDHRSASGQPENIMEHIGCVVRAVAMRLDERTDLDPLLCFAFATFHDEPESVTGDISVRDEEGLALKPELERKAWNHLMPIFGSKEKVSQWIRQMRDGSSPEWKFVKGVDHVENMHAIMRHGGRTWAEHKETFEKIVGSDELYKASIDSEMFHEMRRLLEKVGKHPERYSLPPVKNARGLLRQAVKNAVERRVKQEELELEEKEQREREESQAHPGLHAV